MTTPVVVGLFWHSANSRNMGVGALTVSNIEVVEKVATRLGVCVAFKIFQWSDPQPDYVNADNVEIVRLRARHLLFHPWLLSRLRQCDIVLDIGAGDSFADIYGTRRFMLNVLAKACVLTARRPLVLSPQTIGPFNRPWARWIAGLLMRSAGALITRDNLSTKFVQKFAPGLKLVEATDVAFRLPYEAPSIRVGGPIRIGINVSGLLFNGGYSGQNMFDLRTDYPEMVRSLIQAFLGLGNCEVHLVPHVIPQNLPIENDYLVSEKLQKEFPDIVVAPCFESPSAAKSYIAGLDFFCGSRMHACIAAFSSGIAVMPIAYSRKFAGVFGTLGYKHLADCKIMTAEEVVEVTMQAFQKREILADEVSAGMEQAEIRLQRYEDVLEDIIHKCKAHAGNV